MTKALKMKILVFLITTHSLLTLASAKSGNTTKKITGIDDPIKIIQDYPDNINFPNNFRSVHVINNKGEVYYIRGGDDLVFKQNDVPFPVTAMYTFTMDGENRKIGDIYFGTTNGVYLRKAGKLVTTKIDGIDDPITLIQDYPDNAKFPENFRSVHVVTDKGELFFIREVDDKVFKQTDVPLPVTEMLTFTKDEGNRKIGDIYFGTTDGVYLRKVGSVAMKIIGIDGAIALIQEYPDNLQGVHVVNSKGEVYYIRDSDHNVLKQTDVPYPVLTMYTFTKNGGNRKVGDIYFGTTNGVYLRKVGESKTKKLNEIDTPVVLIQDYPDNINFPGNWRSVHVVNSKGEIYYIRGGDEAVFKSSDILFPVKTMFTFTKDGGSRKTGDIYFGTVNGVYLRKAGGTTSKVTGISGPIKIIQEYPPNIDDPHNLISVNTTKEEIKVNHTEGLPFPLTAMYTFKKDGGIREVGDIYYGTTNGIYLRKFGESTTKKLTGIDDPVTIIQAYPDNPMFPFNAQSVHAINSKGEIFYVRGGDGGIFKQNDVPFPVTAMFTLNEDSGKRKAGDIFFGTTNGVYLRKSNSPVVKINGLDDPIKLIEENSDGTHSNLLSVRVVNKKGEIFYINGDNESISKRAVSDPEATTSAPSNNVYDHHKE